MTMFNLLKTRLKQEYRTIGFPAAAPSLPSRFRGVPVLDGAKCEADCKGCIDICPTSAISFTEETKKLTLDMGRCLFCTDCTNACPSGAITFGSDYRLAANTRSGLVLANGPGTCVDHESQVVALRREMLRIFGRSLKLRQVSAGGCNACEVEINVLNTVIFDLSRFGVQFVASPRHADGLVITGPVTENMRLALQKTYEATPSPKIVIAVGACAISGGIFSGHKEVGCGADTELPVDLYIPGCPPHPITILDGLLRLLGRI